MYDVLYIGAGASSLFSAAFLCTKSSLKVAILEQNNKPAKKLKISGGSKCNVTNVDVKTKHFLGDEEFVDDVLEIFSKDDLLKFLKANKIDLELRKSRYYFCKKSSQEIIDLFLRLSKKADIFYNETALHVELIKDGFLVKTQHKSFTCKSLVVASGGISYKALGVSDIALKIAKENSLHVEPFVPALVGLTLQPAQAWMKSLSGVSFRVKIKINDRVVDEDMLFAHKGISGPAILSASLYWHRGKIEINFLPSFEIDKALLKTNKLISSALPLPKNFMRAFLGHIELADKPCSKLTLQELEKLKTLHSYEFAPAGNFGFDKAEACRGGVSSKEFNSLTLMSKKIKSLYYCGEALDITGELGGYNIQWAFSSGYVVAQALINNDDIVCKR